MTTISVLVATYNGEKFIQEQIISLLSQTLSPMEIVISDDCSTDGTIDILYKLKTTTNIPIRIFINENNKGFQRNFFEAFDYCRGEYVALCDQDDVWLPHKLQRVNDALVKNNYPGMVFSDCELVDEGLNSQGRSGFEFLRITETERNHIRQGDLIKVLLKRPCVTGMTMVCRAAPLKLHKPKIYICPHDYLLSAAFALNSEYAFIDEKLVKYRQHTNNTIGMNTKKRNKPSFMSPNYEASLIKDLLDRCNLLDFSTRFNATEDNAKYNDVLFKEISFIEWRIERCLSFAKLFKKRNLNDFGYSNKVLINAYIKDFRRCLKIQFHKLIFSNNCGC